MLTAVVTLRGELVSVRLQSTTTEPPAEEEAHAEGENAATTEEEHATEAQDEGPSPIAPELKELAWGAGAFIVLAFVMRYVIFPPLRKGMHARYSSIRKGFEDADSLRAEARSEVARYEAALATVKAEAATRVDAVRQQLETERQGRLAEVNAVIAERRAAAAAEAEAARQAAAGQVNAAVATVATRAVELITGKRPSDDDVAAAVDSVTAVGVR